MAKNPTKSQVPLSKKHLDRMHREKMQTRWIMIGSLVVLIAVVGLIVYGILDQKYLRFSRTVATVNGEKISGNDFREFTRYYRNTMIQSAASTMQLAQMFGSDANALQSFGGQLLQISDSLDAFTAGSAALEQMISDRLIRQEAKKRGITVSPEEVEQGMKEAFNYYPNGTPTPTSTSAPLVTSTLSPTQLAMMPPTSTPTSQPSPEATLAITETTPATATVEAAATAAPEVASTPVITATATPAPTPTTYSEDLYKGNYATLVANLGNEQIPEKVIRYVIESQLYQEKLMKEVIGQVACVNDEVWAQHILVADEATAQKVYQLAKDGQDWFKLAAEYSTDTSNKDKGGDLGWFGSGQMVPEFETAAFALTNPGDISQPVKTQFGWHVIRLAGKEARPITASECKTLEQNKFSDWVKQLKDSSEIVTNIEAWQSIVPLQPTLPADIEQAVASLRQAQQQQQQQQLPVTP